MGFGSSRISFLHYKVLTSLTAVRLEIWKQALPAPRLVWMDEEIPQSKLGLNSHSFSLQGHAQVSHTFHEYICQESWTVLSENYSRLEIEESMTAVTGLISLSLVRGILDRVAYIRWGRGVQAYIDCSRDTLVVSATCLHHIERIIDRGVLSDFSSVRKLALRPELSGWGGRIPYFRRGRSPLEMLSILCSSLNGLTVILGHDSPGISICLTAGCGTVQA